MADGPSRGRKAAPRRCRSVWRHWPSSRTLLYAQDRWAVLLIFQTLDAAGKDGAIKHVMSGVNPQGCEVYSFQQRRAVVRRARRQQVVHAGDRGVCDHRYARVARVAVPQGEQGEEEGTGRREAHAAAFRLIMVAPATNCPGL